MPVAISQVGNGLPAINHGQQQFAVWDVAEPRDHAADHSSRMADVSADSSSSIGTATETVT
jgi:hypothetical protein